MTKKQDKSQLNYFKFLPMLILIIKCYVCANVLDLDPEFDLNAECGSEFRFCHHTIASWFLLFISIFSVSKREAKILLVGYKVQNFTYVTRSVADLDPDQYVLGPPGSASARYGSGSFYHKEKIIRKTLIPTVLGLLYDFLNNDVNVASKTNEQKILEKKIISNCHIEGH
jgi:hypothetical protein